VPLSLLHTSNNNRHRDNELKISHDHPTGYEYDTVYEYTVLIHTKMSNGQRYRMVPNSLNTEHQLLLALIVTLFLSSSPYSKKVF
jgi:hypothetical protein